MSVRQFRRPPRLREVIEPIQLDLPQPPTPPRNYPRTPLAQLLLIAILPTMLPPAVLGFAAYIAGAGQTMIITSVALGASLGVAMVVTTLLSRRDDDARMKIDQREYEAQRRQFEQELAFVAHDARTAVAREKSILERQFASPDRLTKQTVSITSALWDRRRDDDDFLELRLGVGQRRTCVRLPREALRTGDPKVIELDEEVAFHDAVPVTAHFRDVAAAAFGESSQLGRFGSWLVSQVAALHAPSDLRVALLTRDTQWVNNTKWLPHCRQTQGGTGAMVASSSREVQTTLNHITDDLNTRSDSNGAHYFVVVDGRDWPSLPSLVEPFLRVQRAGVTVVQLQPTYEEIGGDCAFVVDLTDPGRAVVLHREERDEPIPFRADSLQPPQEREVALALAPLVLLDSSSAGSMPEQLALSDVLPYATTPHILETWSSCRDQFRLAAPIGRGQGGAVVEIDFRKDGPHALLAGTTGSGKSEFLQSMVASFAARIPPDLLNFLLIDYKGGSAFLEVADLPHVVGVVTDLDERLSARALTSLRAEMKRREHLLADAGAANITQYQEKPRPVPLANLIILIDEFHRLVSEVPDFVDQMIQIAQQGRSLGVHLLLSTQKPSGVVSEYIRANTNLRMCLRVTDESDSRDVLGSAEAAHIGRGMPGRLFVRRGNEAIEPCQAGRLSGGSARIRDGVTADWFMSAPPTAASRGVISAEDVTPPRPAVIDAPGALDYRAQLIESIRNAAVAVSMPVQMPPWQPYLPESLALDELQQSPAMAPSLPITFGIVDEPESQSQRPLTVDLAAGHILIAGASNTGKTETMLAIAGAAATAYGSDRVHMYGLDFAGGDLLRMGDLPPCGGVASQTSPAEVRWVLTMLRETVHRRLADGSRGSWPHLLVFTENFPALFGALQATEEGTDATDQLLELLDVGRSVGITFVVSVEQPASLRQNIVGLMSTRVVFALADDESYGDIGLQRGVRPSVGTPGRGLLLGHVPHDVQIALADPRTAKQTPLATQPLQMSPLPPTVAYPLGVSAELDSGMRLGLQDGLDSSFVRPKSEHLFIAGPHGSGRSNTLAVAVQEFARSGFSELFVLNPRRSPLLRTAASLHVCEYAERTDQLLQVWDAVETAFRSRLEAFEKGGDVGEPWAVVIDDAELIEPPFGAADTLRQLIQRGVDVNATVMMSAEPQAARAAFSFDALRALINQQSGILLRPSTTDDFAMFGVRGRPGRLPIGRGYACYAGDKKAVQIYAACFEGGQ